MDTWTLKVASFVAPTCFVGAVLLVYEPLALVMLLAVSAAAGAILVTPRRELLDVTLCGVIAAVVLFPTALYTGTKAGGPLLVYAVLLLLALAYSRRGEIKMPRGALLLVAFVAVTAIADPQAATIRKLAFPAVLAVICYIAAAHARPRPILRFIVYLALGEVLVAFLQTRGLALPWDSKAPGYGTAVFHNEILDGHQRTPGTLGHPLPLSLLFVIAVAILARGKDLFSFRTRIFYGVLLLVGCVLAGSRSSLIIILVTLMFFAGSQGSTRRLLRGAAVLAAGLCLAVWLGFFQSGLVEKLLHSGSVTHREGAIHSISKLFHYQETKHLLLGNGWLGTSKLFQLGLLQTDGFKAVDNQFVTLLVTSGIIGLILFLATAYRCVRIADPLTRLPVLCAASMFVVFDVLLWHSSFVLLASLMGLAAGRSVRVPARVAENYSPALSIERSSALRRRTASATSSSAIS